MVDSPVVPIPDTLKSTEEAIFAGLRSSAYMDVAKSFVGNFMFRADSDPTLNRRLSTGWRRRPSG
jgi:hypothetical protein